MQSSETFNHRHPDLACSQTPTGMRSGEALNHSMQLLPTASAFRATRLLIAHLMVGLADARESPGYAALLHSLTSRTGGEAEERHQAHQPLHQGAGGRAAAGTTGHGPSPGSGPSPGRGLAGSKDSASTGAAELLLELAAGGGASSSRAAGGGAGGASASKAAGGGAGGASASRAAGGGAGGASASRAAGGGARGASASRAAGGGAGGASASRAAGGGASTSRAAGGGAGGASASKAAGGGASTSRAAGGGGVGSHVCRSTGSRGPISSLVRARCAICQNEADLQGRCDLAGWYCKLILNFTRNLSRGNKKSLHAGCAFIHAGLL